MKILNTTSVNIQPDFDKAFDFIDKKLGFNAMTLPVTFTFEERELKLGEKVAFVAINPDQTLTVPVVMNSDMKNTDLRWVVFAHEMYHCIARLLGQKGHPVVDEMDYTFVNGVGIPYYKNWEPYAEDGNFAVMTKKLLPLIKYLIQLEPMVTIKRNKSTDKQTLGTLKADIDGTTFTCQTLELPWRDNKNNISCIPKGTYDVRWTFSPKFMRYTYQVMNVPNRSGIRIHAGNYYYNYLGCIGLGRTLADLNKDGQTDITSTQATVKAFEALMAKRPFTLQII